MRWPWARKQTSSERLHELIKAGRLTEAREYTKENAASLADHDWGYLSEVLGNHGLAEERLELVRNRFGAPFARTNLVECLAVTGRWSEMIECLEDPSTQNNSSELNTALYSVIRSVSLSCCSPSETEFARALDLYKRHRRSTTYKLKHFLVNALLNMYQPDRLSAFLLDNNSDVQLRALDRLMGSAYDLGLGGKIAGPPCSTVKPGHLAVAISSSSGEALLSTTLKSNPDIVTRSDLVGAPSMDYRTGFSYFTDEVDERGPGNLPLYYHWDVRTEYGLGGYFSLALNDREQPEFTFDVDKRFPATPDGWVELMRAVNDYARDMGPQFERECSIRTTALRHVEHAS